MGTETALNSHSGVVKDDSAGNAAVILEGTDDGIQKTLQILLAEYVAKSSFQEFLHELYILKYKKTRIFQSKEFIVIVYCLCECSAHTGDFCYFMDVVQIFQRHSTYELYYNPTKGVIF